MGVAAKFTILDAFDKTGMGLVHFDACHGMFVIHRHQSEHEFM